MVRDYFGTITSNLQCVTANNSEEQSKSHRNAHGRYWPAPVVDPLLQSSAHLKERTALRLAQVTEPWKLVLIQSQPLKIHTKTQHESKSERRTKVMLKAAVGPGPKETFPSAGAEHKLRFFPQCTRFLWAAHPSRSVTVEAHILRKSQWFWLETGHEDLCCSLKHVTQCGHFGETSSSSCFLTRWNSRTLRQNCSSVQLWTDSSSLKQAEGSPVGFCLVRLTQMGPVIWFVLVENCSQELLQVDQHRGGCHVTHLLWARASSGCPGCCGSSQAGSKLWMDKRIQMGLRTSQTFQVRVMKQIHSALFRSDYRLCSLPIWAV